MGWVLVTAAAKPQGPLGSVLILNRLGTGEEPQIQVMEEPFDLGGQWGAWGSIVLTALHLPPDSSRLCLPLPCAVPGMRLICL